MSSSFYARYLEKLKAETNMKPEEIRKRRSDIAFRTEEKGRQVDINSNGKWVGGKIMQSAARLLEKEPGDMKPDNLRNCNQILRDIEELKEESESWERNEQLRNRGFDVSKTDE